MNFEYLWDLWVWASSDGTFATFYAKSLRDGLFNASLTFSGFLLAAYSFLVIHMKSEVYDDNAYRKHFAEEHKNNNALKLYAPLRNLSGHLFSAVVATFIAGILQLTLGLVPANAAAATCVLAAIVGAICVARSLLLMAANLKSWFDILDKEPVPQLPAPKKSVAPESPHKPA
jgi:hypothetical protein